MTIEGYLQSARTNLNETSNSISLAEAQIDELQKKSDNLEALGQKFDEVTAQLVAQQAALAEANAKLAAVQVAHAAFAKLITG